MLRKVVSINNVGTFRNSPASGNVEMRKLTLVHAENGRGKTTLCAILRSLQSGEPDLILERKTLDSEESPQIKILLDAGLREFKNSAWDARCEDVEIFDAAFVAENVYSGDLITHDHKKNLCRVVIGAKGVQLATKFDELDADVRRLNNELNKAKESVDSLAPRGMALEAFISLMEDTGIDKKIEIKKAEVAVLDDAEAIGKKSALSLLELPQPPANFSTMLQRTIDGVAADAEKRIREHLRSHEMTARGEAWVAEGLRYAGGDDCPYCAQSLETSPITPIYATFFSGAYRQFQQELSRLKCDFEASLDEAKLLAVQKCITDNSRLVDFWRRHLADAPPEIDFDNQFPPTIRALRDSMAPLLDEKIASPVNAISYPQDTLVSIENWRNLRDSAQAYNEGVHKFNEAIARVKAAAVTRNITIVRQELTALEAQRARFAAKAVAAVTGFRQAQAKKLATEILKEQAKLDLDAYNATIIDKYRVTVNELLQRFGAAFTLRTVKVEYTGRTPRTAYTFEIRGKEVDPGSDRTPARTPCFGNTLSAGDRNTLALAFFISQIKNRPNLSNIIIVFDDPFTSLDSFRQNWTCNTIRKLSTLAKQVIVLSHSLPFLRLLATRCDKTALSTLQIDRHNTIDSRITELDLDDEVADAVEKDAIQLRNYYTADDKDAAAAIRCIRPLLENHIRRMAPTHCPAGSGWLGDFLGSIQDSDVGSPLMIFKPIYDELDHLNTYTAPYSHDSGKVAVIDDSELSAAAATTLKLIGRL